MIDVWLNIEVFQAKLFFIQEFQSVLKEFYISKQHKVVNPNDNTVTYVYQSDTAIIQEIKTS